MSVAPDETGDPARADALAAARLLGADPGGLGGAVLRGPPGAARDAWLAVLRDALPEGAPWRRLPLAIDDDRLLGGVDLAASLAAGTRVMAHGLLEDAVGGVVIAASAERLPSATAGRIAAAMDAHSFALVLLDEGVEDQRVASALAERCAFRTELESLSTPYPGLCRDPSSDGAAPPEGVTLSRGPGTSPG